MNNRIVRGTAAATRTSSLAQARATMLASAVTSVLEPPTDSGAGPNASDASVSVASTSVATPPPTSLARAQNDRKAASSGKRRSSPSAPAHHFAAASHEEHGSNRQAELFYLQKQIQLQTQMVFVLEDGSRVQGVVEWYDRHTIKIRGKARVLVYKAAIKYLYKAGELGTAPE